MTTRRSLASKRKWHEVLVYVGGILIFTAFLYFITRESGGPPDGG
ncbi:MAG: hypothetical protein ABSH56_33875 [Bryobacteraceae bacterium]